VSPPAKPGAYLRELGYPLIRLRGLKLAIAA
jgi:hypothetical protein